MIPPFDPATSYLPPGIYQATWDEMGARYGYNPQRLRLLTGLKAALDALRFAGCQRAYIDGSFVTGKEIPGDFDGCWDTSGVDVLRLDPVLLVFANRRAAQRARFGGELFPADAPADVIGTYYVDYFQNDADGKRKGVIEINPGAIP